MILALGIATIAITIVCCVAGVVIAARLNRLAKTEAETTSPVTGDVRWHGGRVTR